MFLLRSHHLTSRNLRSSAGKIQNVLRQLLLPSSSSRHALWHPLEVSSSFSVGIGPLVFLPASWPLCDVLAVSSAFALKRSASRSKVTLYRDPSPAARFLLPLSELLGLADLISTACCTEGPRPSKLCKSSFLRSCRNHWKILWSHPLKHVLLSCSCLQKGFGAKDTGTDLPLDVAMAHLLKVSSGNATWAHNPRQAHRLFSLLEQQNASTGLPVLPFQAQRETCQSYTLDSCKKLGFGIYTSWFVCVMLACFHGMIFYSV